MNIEKQNVLSQNSNSLRVNTTQEDSGELLLTSDHQQQYLRQYGDTDNPDLRFEHFNIDKPNTVLRKYRQKEAAIQNIYVRKNVSGVNSEKTIKTNSIINNSSNKTQPRKKSKPFLNNYYVYQKSKQNKDDGNNLKQVESFQKLKISNCSIPTLKNNESQQTHQKLPMNYPQSNIKISTEPSSIHYKTLSLNENRLMTTSRMIEVPNLQLKRQGCDQEGCESSRSPISYNSQRFSMKKHTNLQSQSLSQILKLYSQKQSQDIIKGDPQTEQDNLNKPQCKRTIDFEQINYTSTNKFKQKNTLNYQSKNGSSTLNQQQVNQTTKEQSNNHTLFDQTPNETTTTIGLKKYTSKSVRNLAFPIQTLKHIVSHRKYEESLDNYLQCNNQMADKDYALRKSSMPFKVSFNHDDQKFSLKNHDELYQQFQTSKTIPLKSNKFIKLDQPLFNSPKQSSYFIPSNHSIPYPKVNNEEVSLAYSSVNIIKESSQIKKKTEGDISDLFEDSRTENEKKDLIMNTIKNRKKIGNMIRMIEEFPIDLFNDYQSKRKSKNKQENLSTSLKIKSQDNHHDGIDIILKKILQENNNESINDKNVEVVNMDKLKLQDMSLTEYIDQVQNDSKQYLINQDRLEDFKFYQSKKERKNLDGKNMRANLLKVLTYIKRLNLTPGEIMKNHVFSKRPFEKPQSYEFITAAKHNSILQCDFILSKNKYLVYDFDYVNPFGISNLQLGYNIIYNKKLYMTALHWCCKRGHIKLCQFLIQKGADVNATDILGRTPLYYACEFENIDVVKVISLFSQFKVLLYHQAYPWSTKYINYDKFVKSNPYLASAIFTARKINTLIKMTPFSQRNLIWQQGYIAYEQILQ